MKTLNQLRIEAKISIEEISDFLGISYVETAKIFKERVVCNKIIKEKIKNFLLTVYTKCIDDAFDNIETKF